MQDSVEAVPASCQLIRENVDKCVREKGVQSCKDLMDACRLVSKPCLKDHDEDHNMLLSAPESESAPETPLLHPASPAWISGRKSRTQTPRRAQG
ncbi:unnamed protein product [Knipowitschia caucasica]